MQPTELLEMALGGRAAVSDEKLVEECLQGNEEAWSALVDKYKALIYSVPIRFGLSKDEATDVFQEVCFSLLAELRELRQPRALPAWLANTAWHKCMHLARGRRRYVEWDTASQKKSADGEPLAEEFLQDIESEQSLREAVAELPPRCAELIRMLFYANPPLPYHEVAQQLGLATGSIGFIRMRCLGRLKERLEERGFR